ncbi:Lrp/AsnC family transcriptional regulator [Rhizobium sp. YS-1r]|jgi:Lrp/AsnC family leucine-responsive transcriptional regulator|uniref:Lrp/AsnC family transcriptional regulator n=1 Tax=Rhizobium sp. YS-1r TaxID=1532558 RepID=UPI00068FEF11|nr:Lrp/AsnC family transcriptional regulator [Rhizobium sp. YS-1r]
MSKPKTPPRLRFESHQIDKVDATILEALDADARLSMADLGRLIGMSAPAVSERVRRLETAGVIRGFSLDVDTRALGYEIRALVRIRPFPGKLHLVEKLIQETPQVIEYDRITGDDPFLARLVARSVEEMDEVVKTFCEHAVTSTCVIKSSSHTRRLPPLHGP